jgi:sulfur-oxidizing protein SoxX
MQHFARKLFVSALTLAALTGTLLVSAISPATAADKEMSVIEKGKAVAVDRKKGNCLACHAMGDGKLPGDIGPPLVSMKLRYPDKSKLRDQIWDATRKNGNSIMPPFGKHRMLSEEQIDQIVEYVYTL